MDFLNCRGGGDGNAAIDKFVARENIRRFKEHLKNCTDEAQRATLQQLLAEHEKHLAEIAPARANRSGRSPGLLSNLSDGGTSGSSLIRMP